MNPHQRAGELMGLVRQHLYIGGRAPDGYDDARDMKILRHWLDRGVDYDTIADTIRGLGKLRDDGELKWIQPGEGMTLRVIANREARYGRHLSQTARDYWRQYLERQQPTGHGMGRIRITIEEAA